MGRPPSEVPNERNAMSTADSAVNIDPEIAKLVKDSREAQAEFETFGQEQVDWIVRDIGKYV